MTDISQPQNSNTAIQKTTTQQNDCNVFFTEALASWEIRLTSPHQSEGTERYRESSWEVNTVNNVY